MGDCTDYRAEGNVGHFQLPCVWPCELIATKNNRVAQPVNMMILLGDTQRTSILRVFFFYQTTLAANYGDCESEMVIYVTLPLDCCLFRPPEPYLSLIAGLDKATLASYHPNPSLTRNFTLFNQNSFSLSLLAEYSAVKADENGEKAEAEMGNLPSSGPPKIEGERDEAVSAPSPQSPQSRSPSRPVECGIAREGRSDMCRSSRIDSLLDRTTAKEPSLGPPNVTVIHPSATHPMFPYLYPPGSSLYPSPSHPSLPLHLSHMLLAGHAAATQGGNIPTGHIPLPFLQHSSLPSSADPPHPAAASLWYQQYQAALLEHAAAISSSAAGGYRPAQAPSSRFAPYHLPHKSTAAVTSSSPLSVANLTGNSPTHTSPPPHHPPATHGPRSPPASSSPVTSPRRPSPTYPPAPSSQLHNIERMLSGLDHRPKVHDKLKIEALIGHNTDGK